MTVEVGTGMEKTRIGQEEKGKLAYLKFILSYKVKIFIYFCMQFSAYNLLSSSYIYIYMYICRQFCK